MQGREILYKEEKYSSSNPIIDTELGSDNENSRQQQPSVVIFGGLPNLLWSHSEETKNCNENNNNNNRGKNQRKSIFFSYTEGVYFTFTTQVNIPFSLRL
jgi:hypothetical protein